IRTLESTDKAVRRNFDPGVAAVVFSPDGRHVIVSQFGAPLRLWDIATGEVSRTIDTGAHSIAAFAVDGRQDLLATGDRDGKVRLWKLSTGEALREIAAHDRDVEGLAFHPRRAILFSSGFNGMLSAWDVETGERQPEFGNRHQLSVPGIAVHPTR